MLFLHWKVQHNWRIKSTCHQQSPDYDSTGSLGFVVISCIGMRYALILGRIVFYKSSTNCHMPPKINVLWRGLQLDYSCKSVFICCLENFWYLLNLHRLVQTWFQTKEGIVLWFWEYINYRPFHSPGVYVLQIWPC